MSRKVSYAFLSGAAVCLVFGWLPLKIQCQVRTLTCSGDEPKNIALQVAFLLGLFGLFVLLKKQIRVPLLLGIAFGVASVGLQIAGIYSHVDAQIFAGWLLQLVAFLLMISAFGMRPRQLQTGQKKVFRPALMVTGVLLAPVGALLATLPFMLPFPPARPGEINTQGLMIFFLSPVGVVAFVVGLALGIWGSVNGYKVVEDSKSTNTGT